jgi:hypothetical protein
MGVRESAFMKSILLRLWAVLALLLLNACLNGQEEFWFEKNGSGRLQAEYQLPGFAIASLGGEEALRKTITDYFAKEPGVTMENLNIEKRGAQAVLTLAARFDSVTQLAKMLEKPAAGSDGPALPEPMVKLLGEVNVKRSGLDVDFQRRIDPRQVFAGGLVTPTQSQMAGYQLEYIMHLPTAVKTSNAHEVRDGGRTVVWRYELAEAMKKPVETNFTAPIPIPWWAWCLLLGVLVLVLFAIRKWRRRKTP